MKQLLLILGLIFSVSGIAQNGGQSAENNSTRIDYIGYSGGSYLVKITNKQGCPVNYRATWLSHDSTTAIIPANSFAMVQLPGAPVGGTPLNVKPLINCDPGSGNLGWLEIESPQNLPIKLGSLSGTRVGNKIQLSYEVIGTTDQEKHFIEVSLDGGKSWKRIWLTPEQSTVGKHTELFNQ